MANLVPLGNHIVVKPSEEMSKSAAGILLPDKKEERPQKGIVIAVGPGLVKENGDLLPMSVAIGDTVIFKKYSPDEIELEGEKVLVLSESDVLAKLQ